MWGPLMGAPFISLTDRSKRVLYCLLTSEERLTLAHLATRLSLTVPQIRYSLQMARHWLASEGCRLMTKPRVGVWIDASPQVRQRLLFELEDSNRAEVFLDGDDRLQIVLLRILAQCQEVDPESLRERFGVSRTTIYRDLNSAKQWLKQRNLHLVSRRRKGLHLKGQPADRRRATIELLLGSLEQNIMIAACAGEDSWMAEQAPLHDAFAQEAEALLCEMNLKAMQDLISGVEKVVNLRFVDRARIKLGLHLGLIARDTKKGMVPSKPRPTGTSEVSSVSEGARWMTRCLSDRMQMTFGLDDEEYIETVLMDAMKTGTRFGQRSVDPQFTSLSAVELASTIACEAGKYLHAGLAFDSELKDCLALELEASSSQPYAGAPKHMVTMPGEIPLLLGGFTRRVIRPALLSSGHSAPWELANALGVHVATALQRLTRGRGRRKVWIVCGAHLATARNLVNRLSLNLPELDILGLASAVELSMDPDIVEGSDAVISTIDLSWIEEIPIVLVSPMLSERDIASIRDVLGLQSKEGGGAAPPDRVDRPSIAEILSKESIAVGLRVRTWQEVVQAAGQALFRVGAVWPSYIGAMEDMIRLYGPYMVVAPGAALLHASPEMGARRLAVSLVILATPVPFGHEAYDPVRLAFALSSVDYDSHLRVVEEAMGLLASQESRESILGAVAPEDALARIDDELSRMGPVRALGQH